MYSAPRSILAVAVVLISSFSGPDAFPQGVKFIRDAADPLPLAKRDPGRAPCTRHSGSEVHAHFTSTTIGTEADSPCDEPPVTVSSVNMCNSPGLTQMGCNAPKDLVQENLTAMGKPGQKILRAREKVLEILQAENACSAWFREKDPSPAATFQTLSYDVDHRGADVVHVSRDTGPQYTYRDPYVAKVGQDTGAFATITLNAGGAFFHVQATTLVVSKESGLSKLGGPRLINIGPYTGDSAAAQTLALLHEFGHVLNLLPVDFDNEDGKSMQNTAEVLRFCRAGIESGVKQGKLSVAR
jgi:hypothetical protein